MKWAVICSLLLSCLGWADDLQKSFPSGEGAKFSLDVGMGSAAEVTIYSVGGGKDRVSIECYFNTSASGLPLELWQQTAFERRGKKVDAVDAYILSGKMKKPQRFNLRSVKAMGSLDLSDFLKISAGDIAMEKIGDEQVETPAGEVRATHFRKQKGGDVIDYWLSDEAKPLGIVKVVAKGKNAFTLSLESIVRNVGAKINPEKSEPLGKEGKELLNLSAVMPLN